MVRHTLQLIGGQALGDKGTGHGGHIGGRTIAARSYLPFSVICGYHGVTTGHWEEWVG